MNHLLRQLAPISDTGWQLLDGEAKARLMPALAARKLVDFQGPHGWEYSATNIGRAAPLVASPGEGVSGHQRAVLAVVELRAEFSLSRTELRDIDRGAADPDLEALDRAAHRIAVAENTAVFHGLRDAVTGISEASPHEPISLGAATDGYPAAVAEAVERLLLSGIGGPYGLALGNDQYRDVIGTSEGGGYPLAEHVGKILDGPTVWAPGVDGAIVISQRGGDFTLDCGQEMSIGYDSHDRELVKLYLEESFSFRVATPEAAVALARRKLDAVGDGA
jgi:uncharacterized linocin/CFP29 family protein